MSNPDQTYVDKLNTFLANNSQGEFYARKFLVLLKKQVFDTGNTNVIIHLDDQKLIRKIQKQENEEITE